MSIGLSTRARAPLSDWPSRALAVALPCFLAALLCSCAGFVGTRPPPPLPAIKSFAAAPSSISPGQSSTLSWSVSGASTVSISSLNSSSPSGSAVVSPATTTTYTLTATNSAGTVTGSATVTVASSTPPGPIATAEINPNQPGLAIPPDFMGFSHEWTVAQELMGAPSTGTNPIYRRLVQNLLAYGAGPFIVRIGGKSTDESGPPVSGLVAPFAQLHQDLGANFTLGVNLASDDLALATSQATAFVQGMPSGSLLAVEIGNEPDRYAFNGFRPATYTFDDYLSDFAAWRTAILPLLPSGVKLMGPSWSAPSILPKLPVFLAQESPNLSIVSQHWYAGSQCNGDTNPTNYLLEPTASTSGPLAVASSVSLAHADGLPFRMGEMNSIACGGELGVSNIFSSALWSADSLFEFASVGVDGVNFHNGNGGNYALFSFKLTTDATTGAITYSLNDVRPEYYGLLFFQQAAPAGARLLPVSLSTSANLKIWATLDSSGAVRVAVINKDQSASGTVNLSLPGFGPASLTRLLAASYQSTSGITLAGQSFDTSTDGAIRGTAQSETVAPSAGLYSFSIAHTSAALLTLQPQ